MNFSVLPPEINSALILAGSGSEPMAAAATAWDGLAEELASAAASFGEVTSGLVGGAWQGASSATMAAVAAPYAGWLAATAIHTQQAAAQAKAMVSEFEAVRSAIVQPALVAANRSDLVALVVSNLFGQNAPVIAATEAAYEEMWALDVSVIAAYHGGASAVVAALTPFTAPLQNVAGAPTRLVTALGSGTPAAAPFAAAQVLTNLGLANVGGGNIGNANNGQGNLGSANLGDFNIGSGNLGSSNYGWANLGVNNIGAGNAGSGNQGLANIGDLNAGFVNSGVGNFGLANTGNNNIGIGLTGNNQIGIGRLNSGGRQLRAVQLGNRKRWLLQLRYWQLRHRQLGQLQHRAVQLRAGQYGPVQYRCIQHRNIRCW